MAKLQSLIVNVFNNPATKQWALEYEGTYLEDQTVSDFHEVVEMTASFNNPRVISTIFAKTMINVTGMPELYAGAPRYQRKDYGILGYTLVAEAEMRQRNDGKRKFWDIEVVPHSDVIPPIKISLNHSKSVNIGVARSILVENLLGNIFPARVN